ncbi:MAG: hypothetical protein HYY05_02585 [Chloroflexi bacterium]|nr:hypothetical protein [Chloroflexota bacterium]
MQVEADLKCYHCGHISGQLVGALHARSEERTFRPEDGSGERRVPPGHKVRCLRCGGPTFVDEIRTYRPLEDLAQIRAEWRSRRHARSG